MSSSIVISSERTDLIGANHRAVIYEPETPKLNLPPFLAVHGMWATDLRWEKFGRLFSQRGFRFVAPSFRYHHPGNQTIKALGETSVLDYVDDMIDLIKKLNLGLPIIIGHSMGGLVALKLAEEGFASKLILINSAPPAGINLHADWRYQLAVLRYLPKILLQKSFRPNLRLASYYIMNRMPKERWPELYQGMVHESGRAAWEIKTGKITIDFNKITCPALVIGCGEDLIVRPEVASDIYHNLLSLRSLKIYRHNGHWPQVEYQWEDVAENILQWLAFNILL